MPEERQCDRNMQHVLLKLIKFDLLEDSSTYVSFNLLGTGKQP